MLTNHNERVKAMANLYHYCKGCESGCDSSEAASKQSHGLCDPCDGCFNYSSPACLDCDAPVFANFEADCDGAGASDRHNQLTALAYVLIESSLKR